MLKRLTALILGSQAQQSLYLLLKLWHGPHGPGSFPPEGEQTSHVGRPIAV